MHTQSETQQPRLGEIATLLRGEVDRISAWSGSGNVRRLGLHTAVIMLKLTYE